MPSNQTNHAHNPDGIEELERPARLRARLLGKRAGVLTRYWFEFVRGGRPTALSLGCGITAYSLDDARRILRQAVFPLYGERAVARAIEGVDVASLDAERVRPHLGNSEAPGVWFPVAPQRANRPRARLEDGNCAITG
jgi:hypothetical protein